MKKYLILFTAALLCLPGTELGAQAPAAEQTAITGSPQNTAPAPRPRRGTSQGVPEARLGYEPGSTPGSWAVAIAETVMARYPDYRTAYWKDWTYVQGYMLTAFDRLYEATGQQRWLDYMRKYADNFVDREGNYTGDRLTNLDNMMTGALFAQLYRRTKDERYRKAATQMVAAFGNYPRSEGQFWHGDRQPAMWIDGVFMGQMFLIEYGKYIGKSDYCFSEAAHQILICAKHLEKGNSGMFLHAWTTLPEGTAWADPQTGLSPEVWSEGMGWFALTVPELLAVLPAWHPDYEAVKAVYLRMAAGLKKHQDKKSGGWFLIVDKNDAPGNWIDASGTAMFTYSIRKGIDIGLLDAGEYGPVAQRGFECLSAYMRINDRGLVEVYDCGDGIVVKKDYEGYISVPKILNAKEAVAGLLWASEIMERERPGK